MFDVIIIGSGPSGLTAAIYTSRASLKTLVLAGKIWGGQLMLTTEVENFPGFPEGIMGPELMIKMRKQAERFGAKVIDKDAVKVDFSQRPFKVYTQVKNPSNKNSSEYFSSKESSETKISSFVDSKENSSGPFFSSRRGQQNSVGSSDTKTVNIRASQVAKLSPSEKDPFGFFYQAKSIIVATGADTMWLNIPGEQKFIGRGISSCAPCDAFFYRGKKVIVVGGGDSAMEEALVLAKFATEVTIIHRRDEFRASKIMQEKVFKNPKIKVLWNTFLKEIIGEKKVEKVRLISGKKEWEMAIDGVFVAIGHKPNSSLFEKILKRDAKGYLVRKTKTEEGLAKYSSASLVPGVFIAGDVHDYAYRQAVTAAGFGTQAAMDSEKWLEGGK